MTEDINDGRTEGFYLPVQVRMYRTKKKTTIVTKGIKIGRRHQDRLYFRKTPCRGSVSNVSINIVFDSCPE